MPQDPETHTMKLTKMVSLDKIKNIAKETAYVKINKIVEEESHYLVTFEYYDLNYYACFFIKFGNELGTILNQKIA